LLCSHCNLALGHMFDDSVRMYKAVEYLDCFNSRPSAKN
jgi:peptide methionine sulfoxide reductase MsrB